MPADAASAPECRRKFSGLYKVLHPKSQRPLARAFRGLMALVILVDVGTCFLATVPSMHAAPAWRSLDACDRVTTAIFLAEYLLRLLVVTESTTYAHPIRGRLKYMLSWGARSQPSPSRCNSSSPTCPVSATTSWASSPSSWWQ